MPSDVIDEGWLCVCGHYEETDFHCSSCGHEPPWGCNCPFCEKEEVDETEIAIWNALCDSGFEI